MRTEDVTNNFVHSQLFALLFPKLFRRGRGWGTGERKSEGGRKKGYILINIYIFIYCCCVSVELNLVRLKYISLDLISVI